MKSFNILIEELVSEDIVVEAKTREEAINKAINMYKQGIIVLCPGHLEMKRIQLSDNPDEWIEF